MERVLVTRTPAEGKRLVGKAVAMMEPVTAEVEDCKRCKMRCWKGLEGAA